jgi:uncharacterized protein with FMN-binding domain
MDKSTLLLLAAVLAVFGASVAAGYPAWGTFTGFAIILLAAGLAAGTLPIHALEFLEERTAPSQRISNGLVTLSSATIVAIYAAGYYRTSLAAHKFDLQTPQQRASANTTAMLPPPPAANPGSDASAAESAPPATPRPKKSTSRPANPGGKAAPSKSSDSAAASSAPSAAPTANPEAPAPPGPAPAATQARYKDGMYSGWGSCRHGDIEASVTVQDGKIASVVISQCLTRYSCAWIAPKNPNSGLPDLPAQVVERQSPKVDYVSGATESSYAFADAVVAALSKATE